MDAITLQRRGHRPAATVDRVAPLEDRVVLSGAGLAMHIHVYLSLYAEGAPITVPANVGVGPTVVQPIHTHDANGTIHVESDEVRPFRLGEFFTVWNKSLSPTQFLDQTVGSDRRVTMTVNGQANDQLGDYILHDNDRIVVSLERKPAVADPRPTAFQIVRTPEYYQHLTKRLYTDYLGRSADDGGLAYWSGLLQSGMTVEQVEARFLTMPEFVQTTGGTGRGWLDTLYRGLLHRNAEEAGSNYWLGRLETGMTAHDVAHAIAASGERWGVRVENVYAEDLGRTPTAGERADWVARASQGLRAEDFEAAVVGSPEYFGNPLRGQSDTLPWVRSAYTHLLGRAPSDGEANYWTTWLAGR